MTSKLAGSRPPRGDLRMPVPSSSSARRGQHAGRCRQPACGCRRHHLLGACRYRDHPCYPRRAPAPPFRSRGWLARPGAGDSSLDASTAAVVLPALAACLPHLGRPAYHAAEGSSQAAPGAPPSSDDGLWGPARPPRSRPHASGATTSSSQSLPAAR